MAFVLAFAAGAILTMLADTMMPEGFEHGGKLVGIMTTLGFAIAFTIHTLDRPYGLVGIGHRGFDPCQPRVEPGFDLTELLRRGDRDV